MKTNRLHYSWSQHSLFLSSKASFYKRYVLGEEQKSNIRFDKGKEFGEYKETGHIPHYCTDPLLEEVAEIVPSLDLMEHKLVVDLFKDLDEKPVWAKPILMFADSAKKDYSKVLEYKTGKEPWTQQKVDDHEQLDFYAMCYYVLSGQTKIPEFELWWIETEDITLPNGKTEVRYTGHVESFERTFTEKDILNQMMRTFNTMKEIHEWEYNEIEVEDEKMERYVELLDKKDEIEKELNLIKLEIETEMAETNIKYAVGKLGKFSISQRKNYSYSDKLTKLIDKYDKEIKKKQSQEKKDGTAKISYTESIRFTRNKN